MLDTLWKISLLIVAESYPIALLAQTDNLSSLSGGAGWVGAGLLGLVLGWLLLVHLPAKDKQINELLATHRGERDALLVRYDTSLERIMKHSEETNTRAYAEMSDKISILSTSMNVLSVAIKGLIDLRK